MTNACKRMARPLRLAALAMAPGSLCVGTPASADSRIGLDVSAGGSVETKPYLERGASADVSANVQVSPFLKIEDSVSSIDVRGDFTLSRYASNSNGTNIAGSASLSASHQVSSYLGISGGVNYQTSRNGINQGFAIVGPNDPVPPPTTPLPDISLGGTRTRTQSLSSNLGATVRLSELDQLGANVSVSHSAYGSSAGKDFNYVNSVLSYSRALTPRISLNASVRYGKSDYIGTRVGDGSIFAPEAGIEITLGKRITLSASLGASFSRSKLGLGAVTLKSTTLSGHARACGDLDGGAVCLSVARSAQPTGIGTISTLTSVSLGYSKRLSGRDTVNVNLGMTSSSDRLAPLAGPETSKYYTAGASWSHNFNRRLSAFAMPSYSRVGNPLNSYNVFRLTAGVSYRFGAVE